jgi:hypothetical protein
VANKEQLARQEITKERNDQCRLSYCMSPDNSEKPASTHCLSSSWIRAKTGRAAQASGMRHARTGRGHRTWMAMAVRSPAASGMLRCTGGDGSSTRSPRRVRRVWLGRRELTRAAWHRQDNGGRPGWRRLTAVKARGARQRFSVVLQLEEEEG